MLLSSELCRALDFIAPARACRIVIVFTLSWKLVVSAIDVMLFHDLSTIFDGSSVR